MKEYYGKKIFGGIAIGKISFYLKNQNVVVRKRRMILMERLRDTKKQEKKPLNSFTVFMRRH